MKGLVGPRFYQRQPPTKLQILGRQALLGGLLWTLGVALLGSVFGRSPLSIVAGVFAVGGWFALLWLNVRYFYYFVYRNDDRDLKRQ
ncbi:MAG TPA: hypothetical protein VD861_14715 [Pyrinomonadaceae bacterium]|jgi:hypothetical protein|nr:hypothetical protein [Pyrinomonadaceae bacterium]